MASSDPGERHMIAQRAAYIRWAHEDNPTASGVRGQSGLLRKFYNETDPSLPDSERWKRAERLRRAHMIELSRKAARSRAAKVAQEPT